MKKPVSIKLDEQLWVYIKNKTNKSRFISELIKQDMQAQVIKPIVDGVREKLLQDEVFISEISSRMSKAGSTAYISSPVNAPFVPRPPDPTTGYPCCSKATPCKHWTFDGTDDVWTNTLTGATRNA